MAAPEILPDSHVSAQNVAEVEILRIAPNSRPQTEFLMAEEMEVLYGGAAGGGKSLAIVMDPMRYLEDPDFTGVIFRRTYPELENSILPHCHRLYPHAGGYYHSGSKAWKFPSGCSIRLGHMEYETDWVAHAGGEYAYQGFDELTTFHETQVTMLRPWNRSRSMNIRPYRRYSTNPGNIGHAWVKRDYVTPMPPVPDGPERYSELARAWWQPMKSAGPFIWHDPETGNAITRRFIPARVFDNEDLLKRNPEYLSNLLSLPEYRRKALLEGSWDLFEGQFFGMWRTDLHVIKPIEKPPKGSVVVGGLDYGQKTVLEVMYRDYEGVVVNFAECFTMHETPEDRAVECAEMLIERKLHNILIVYDTNMGVKLSDYQVGVTQTPIAAFKKVFRQLMGDNAPRMLPVAKNSPDNRRYRVVCNEAVKQGLSYKADFDGKMVRRPTLYVTRDCPHLINEFGEFVHDPSSLRGMDFEETDDDNSYDGFKYGYMKIRKPIAEVPEEQPADYEQYLTRIDSRLPLARRGGWRDPFHL